VSKAASIVWFQQDLRLDDNPALRAAVKRGGPVIPLFVWSPQEQGHWPPGAASRWWLHHSLQHFDRALDERGMPLIVREGETCDVLTEILKQTGADAVYWNRRYEPAARELEKQVHKRLTKTGDVTARRFHGSLLYPPDSISSKEGNPYKRFTPFWKACQKADEPAEPANAPRSLTPPNKTLDSLTVDQLGLLPEIDWASGLRETWTPGERGAHNRMREFLRHGLANYEHDRDRPDIDGTSRLSPHLHYGEISPRRLWHEVIKARNKTRRATTRSSADTYLRELGWREFGHHVLFHFPHTPRQPLQQKFARFPWEKSSKSWRAWRNGQTGYPVVDAGMRQLWHTGWMHNRVRMIVASFLVKHLLQRWQNGAEWFWDTLVDADLANNTLGWQWAGGCGADAAPYFRIFNPTLQGHKFDPDGTYTRHWVPELKNMPIRYLFAPSEAPRDVLKQANVRLGETYPKPIVEHKAARQRALRAFDKVKG